MGHLRVDEYGRLELASVADLTREALQAWIEARLHGEDIEVSGAVGQSDLPHYLLAQIYPDLEREVRRDMRRIVQGFLRDMARNEASSWQGEAAHALLLLAQSLEEQDFIDPILEMAQEGRFFEEAAAPMEDLHHRLLQSLTMLEWRGTPDFWEAQRARNPVRYAGVVFAGLACIALQHALNVLPRLPWESEDVQDQMRIGLRGLLPAHAHDKLGAMLNDVLPRLHPAFQQMIRQFLPELHIFIKSGPSWLKNTPIIEAILRESGQEDFRSKQLAFSPETTNGAL